MRQRGYDPVAIPQARRQDIEAFLELHVEQGKILESEGIDIGVVHTITGITHSRFEIIGQSNHAGTTPMDSRRDPINGFAEMALGINRIAREAGRPAVATIGIVQVSPGAATIIPGRVEFTLDLRHPESSVREQLNEEMWNLCRRVAQSQTLEIRREILLEIPGSRMNPGIVKTLEEAARTEGVSFQPMVSAAGHDAQMFAQRLPTAMIFVPTRGGLSHCPDEYTSVEAAIKGIGVLARALYHMAYESG
jgi:allantoate deiminase